MSFDANVLIVDDNENNRYTLKRRLARLGYRDITESEDGVNALSILEQGDFDIVLLDVMMPIMDGFKVLEKIKDTPKLANVSVIMISAIDDIESVVKAIEMGADDYLPKPFNPILLDARMKAAIRKRRLVNIETNYYKDFDKDTDFAKSELFTGSLDNEMNKNLDTSYAVIYIRFAHYNFINQTLSSELARDYIQQQAIRLCQICTDPNTTIGRIADDVFAIYNSAKSISKLADEASMIESFLSPLCRPILLDEEQFEGNVGIGISMAKGREKKPKALISNAAFASQTALDNDTGLAFYDPELHQSNLDKFHLEPKLREAIKSNRLMLYYQPIVNSQTGEIETFEALIRWQDTDGQFISPFKFITLAEETGLIYDIDAFVIDETCRQISAWRQKYGEDRYFSIGVNISAKHWVNPILIQEVRNALNKYQIPPQFLKLEMTESAMVDDAKTVKNIVMALKAMGVQIALDDFGTGYSSLGYLIEFPVDILKVDRVFVVDLNAQPRRQQLMNHILSIAKSLGMRSIVEGVETKEQVDILKQFCCDQIQGYHFYKPMPVEEIEKIFI